MGNSSWQKTEAGTHLQSPDPLKLSDKTEEVTELRQQLTNWGLCLLLACEEHLFYVCMILVAVHYCDYSSVRKLLHFRCNFLHPWDMHYFFWKTNDAMNSKDENGAVGEEHAEIQSCLLVIMASYWAIQSHWRNVRQPHAQSGTFFFLNGDTFCGKPFRQTVI